MKSKDINLITVGYAKQAFIPGSRERARMMTYARKLKSFQVIVFTKKKDGLRDPITEGNLTLYPTNSICRPFMLVRALVIGFDIVSRLKKEKTIISSQDPFETSLVGRILSWVTRIPHHVQLHGDNFSDDGAWRTESIINRIRYWFGLYIVRGAQHVRVASERIKRSLIKRGVDETRITVLPIRPELERFLSTEHHNSLCTTLVFLTVSRLAPEKNIPLMLRAFKSFLETHPGHTLRITGSGSEEASIRRLIQELVLEHAVTLIPWSNNVSSVMQDADVFLLASDHEAYGLVLVEALASGLPIVTTNVGCVGEVVKDGVHGVVVEPHDEAGYVRALIRITDNPVFRTLCGQNGKETAQVLSRVSEESYTEAWVAAHSSP